MHYYLCSGVDTIWPTDRTPTITVKHALHDAPFAVSNVTDVSGSTGANRVALGGGVKLGWQQAG